MQSHSNTHTITCHPACCMSTSVICWKSQHLSLSYSHCKGKWQQSFFFHSASSRAAVSHKIINIMRRWQSELALFLITQELGGSNEIVWLLLHTMQGNCVAVSQRIFWRPEIESIPKAVRRIEDGKAHLRLLNVQICMQPPFQEILQRRQKSGGHTEIGRAHV